MSRSAEELFRDAPEGATHWDASDSRINSFMKFDKGQWFYWPPASAEPHWCRWGDNTKQDVAGMIERPQSKPWSGPEDGLPPVGMVCEAEYINAWLKVECIGHYKDYAICVREYLTKDDDEIIDVDIYPKNHLRTICHGAKLAASSRETAIRELMDIAQVDCRVTAARLVDAGFKREVV